MIQMSNGKKIMMIKMAQNNQKDQNNLNNDDQKVPNDLWNYSIFLPKTP